MTWETDGVWQCMVCLVAWGCWTAWRLVRAWTKCDKLEDANFKLELRAKRLVEVCREWREAYEHLVERSVPEVTKCSGEEWEYGCEYKDANGNCVLPGAPALCKPEVQP